ncbi:hypothetical protein LSTR_LSTR000975 [Laodelphax striatellus]|uniref:Uncharacterized protein n=1 Tax=Laodelphax striatellus TaxID=195883 RepID=A0A482X0W2_LAOST|nr:hypothetical protein LSTR_LSTR000975 [Laodelphax striatellus]
MSAKKLVLLPSQDRQGKHENGSWTLGDSNDCNWIRLNKLIAMCLYTVCLCVYRGWKDDAQARQDTGQKNLFAVLCCGSGEKSPPGCSCLGYRRRGSRPIADEECGPVTSDVRHQVCNWTCLSRSSVSLSVNAVNVSSYTKKNSIIPPTLQGSTHLIWKLCPTRAVC